MNTRYIKFDVSFRPTNIFDKYLNLPLSLTQLTLNSNFNLPIKLLPPLLTHLIFGNEFNQPIDLPSQIIYLSLSSNNEYIINNLPNGIEKLHLFDKAFDLELNNLPTSIKTIIFTNVNFRIYDKKLNCLPDSVEYIKLPLEYKHRISNIPKKLKNVSCSYGYEYIDDFRDLGIKIKL